MYIGRVDIVSVGTCKPEIERLIRRIWGNKRPDLADVPRFIMFT